MISIEILNTYGDNFIYLVEYGPGLCFVVDPGDARPVEAVLIQRHITLTHVLITHHHFDHTGGMGPLKQKSSCKIIGPAEVTGTDTVIDDGDIIEFGGLTVHCIATPGHTSGSVCYFVTGQYLEAPVLFSGDTLFSFGCGRLSGDTQTMFESLQKLAALPNETRVYPGHDYTEENLQFALTIEPGNMALQKKLDNIHHKSQQGHPTVPSTIAEEKKINVFIKAETWQEFAELRKKKNTFG